MAKEKSSRNTVALNTIVSTLTVPTPQPPCPLIDKENGEQLSDARYKDKGKTPEISLTNTETGREESSSFTFLCENRNITPAPSTIPSPVASVRDHSITKERIDK
jgi:hypothetical protein